MNLRRWTEPTRPICPYALKSGDRACAIQCVHCFQEGQNEKGEKIYGCRYADETALNVWKLKREAEAMEPNTKIGQIERPKGGVNG